MSDFNKSFVMGRLVRNAETKTTSEGLLIITTGTQMAIIVLVQNKIGNNLI